MLKICFLAPSGYGKSTAIKLLSKSHKVKNIKIAKPLYDIQTIFYNMLGIDIEDKQDGELLQFLGMKIRKESKYYLLDTFKNKLRESEKDNVEILSNDDCRPMDYDFLKELGFIFVKINGYKRDRDDRTPVDSKNALEWNSEIPFDYEIDNIGDIADYEKELNDLLFRIENKITKCYIFPTVNVCNCDYRFCTSKTRDFTSFKNFLEVDDNFTKNIELLKKRGIKRFEITGSGEPFCNNNLQKIIDTIKKIIPDSYIKLYTNGYILKEIKNIDELNISIVHFDDDINNDIMEIKGEGIPLLKRLDFFSSKEYKLSISIVVSKNGIKTPDELDKLIKLTGAFADSYVVRTIYNETNDIDDFYVDFEFEHEKVIWEKDNTGKALNNLILATDGNFYSDFELKNRRYLYSYIMLKPDSKQYINEILEEINALKFNILDYSLIDNFKYFAPKLYYLKEEEYFELILKHIDFSSFLFGNNALILSLDADCSIEELLYKTTKLKTSLRKKYSLTGNKNSYISLDDILYHLNLIHCPDSNVNCFDKDISIINGENFRKLSNSELEIAKNYKTYEL